jgi:RNA polymerase sigma factor (sigma-70 family)
MTEDAELLRRFAEDRSEPAFRELVQRHLNLVYSAALRRLGGDTHLAEDAAQQVFIALAQQAQALSRRPILTGWLYTSARFASAGIVRTERRRQSREQEAYVMNEETTPARDWEQLHPVIDELMDQLPERDREALLLRFFAGSTFSQLGEKLQLSEDAARKRVDRALIRLRDRLAKRGIISTATAVSLLLETNTIAAAPAALASVVTGSALSAVAGVAPGLGAALPVIAHAKLLLGLAALGAVLLAGWVAWEVSSGSHDRAALADVERENAALQVTLSDLARRVRSEEAKQLASAEKRTASPRASLGATPSVKSSTPAVSETRDPQQVGRDLLARFPEMSALVAGNTRASLTNTYQLLFKKLGLGPDQVERFLDIMAQTGGVRWNTQKQAPIGEITSSPLTEGMVVPELQRLLGDEGFQTYQDFIRQRNARDLVVRLGGSVYFTSEPLQPTQADQLVEILAQASPSYREGRNADDTVRKFKDVMMENAERVLDIKAVGRDQNLTLSDPAMRTLLQQADEQLREAEIGVLGADGYQQLRTFERQAPAREMVESLAGLLAFTDTPLGAAPAQQLAQILAEANSEYQAGGNADRFPQIGRTSRWLEISLAAKGFPDPTDWNQVLVRAATVLSEPQLALFKSRAEQERTTLELYNTMQKGTPEPVIGFILGGRK